MRNSAFIAAIIAAGLAIPTPVLAEGAVSGSGEFGTGATSNTASEVTITDAASMEPISTDSAIPFP